MWPPFSPDLNPLVSMCGQCWRQRHALFLTQMVMLSSNHFSQNRPKYPRTCYVPLWKTSAEELKK